MLQAHMTFLKPHVLTVALLLGSMTSACKDEALFETPDFDITGVQAKRVRVDGFDFDLQLKVTNPNTVKVFADHLQYEVFVENKRVSMGKRKERAEVKAKGQRVFRMPMTATYEDVKGTWKRMASKKVWNWHVAGKIGFDTPLGMVYLPFTKASSFPAPTLPIVRFSKPRISRIDLRGVTLALDAEIENKNGFGLPKGEAEYQIEVLNKGLEKTRVKIPAIAKKSKVQVKFEQRVNAKDITSTLMRALTKPKVSAKVKGQLKVGDLEKAFDSKVTFRR